MKKRTIYLDVKSEPPATLREVVASSAGVQEDVSAPMIRTQIYLTRGEYDYLQNESTRRGQPMAAVIRTLIDDKMRLPEDLWQNNPMLASVGEDPDWQGREDAALNHDHYVSGSPRKWVKQNGQWVVAPPLPEDYYDNPKSRVAYDAMVEAMR